MWEQILHHSLRNIKCLVTRSSKGTACSLRISYRCESIPPSPREVDLLFAGVPHLPFTTHYSPLSGEGGTWQGKSIGAEL
ncbi:hypothetical protein CDAR_384251 [Caerostris darwini]|uniref:Uncharacterized protein n=1 Tax=Caerostris darwini TaxID=1538125 RepID=A0AAV4QXJ9_9ARAC|nr:hypothetical protein CDAR_384251 [Caerostris darwini]